MTRARTRLAILAMFALPSVSGSGVTLAADRGDNAPSSSRALISVTKAGRAVDAEQLLINAFTACISATYARSENHSGRWLRLAGQQPSIWKRVSSDDSARLNQGSTGALPIHYPIWLQRCRRTSYI
jgi:hypothetical protein